MKKSSPFKRTFCDGWDLICDQALPEFCYPAESADHRAKYLFNPLYTVVVFAAAAGIAASIIGRFFASLLPANGAAMLFAGLLFTAGEMRTGFRGMALSVSFFEKLLSGKKLSESLQLRQDDLQGISGVVPLLLAVAAAGIRLFALYIAARSGNYGITGAAWIAAAAAEGFLTTDPSAVNMPDFCTQAKGEYIAAAAGFFLLFILLYLPLATLIAAGVSALLVIVFMSIYLKNTGRISSNDITMCGYLLELAVLLIYAVMIG